MLKFAPILLLALAGCTKTVEVPVIKEVVREVKVPVPAPCMGPKPEPVTSVRDTLSREEWDALGTDQRDKLLGSNHAGERVYSQRLTVASSGCL